MNKVTYIVNTFNREDKVFSAIDSIIKQEGVILDIIVIDDCSDIDIGDKINSLYGDSVTYIKNKINLGLSRSRQLGLELAKTEFVAFLDDDDFLIDNNKTKRHIDILSSNDNVSVVCSNVKFVRGELYTSSNIDFPENLYSHLLKRNGIIYPSTTTVKKCHVLNVGGFDFKFPRGIDSDVYRRIVKNGYRIFFEKEETVCYQLEADDKITSYNTISSIKKDITSNYLVIRKYYRDMFLNPCSLIFRLKVIVRGLFSMGKLNLINRFFSN
ncbi:glycosyltransferase family 2 protein [Acinetobacter venetianus]|uniref:glycosyltransferase family 2 protein n=1 Tax=Acinetobacter venetianus TaxID=52133 RepID=UPI003A950617